MLASELIQRLDKTVNTYGDHEVVIVTDDPDFRVLDVSVFISGDLHEAAGLSRPPEDITNIVIKVEELE